jgi:hypothetical protein
MTVQPLPPPTPVEACECEQPLPRQQAVWKGAARTVCERCGLPVPLTLKAG